MPKYRVEFHELVKTEVFVDAKDLGEAVRLVTDEREEAGNKNYSDTDYLEADIHHSKGIEKVRIIDYKRDNK